MGMTSKTKKTYILLECTLRWTYSVLQYFFYMMAPLKETDCNAAARAHLTTCLDCHMYCTLYMQPFLLTPTARLTSTSNKNLC